MKDKIIKFVKKHPFLYNLAKKVNRKLNRMLPKQVYCSNIVYYIYTMNNIEELELIKRHYKSIQTGKSKLLVVIENKENQMDIHRLMRENLTVLFLDLNYFKKYKKKLHLDRAIMLDYHENKNQKMLEYIDWGTNI